MAQADNTYHFRGLPCNILPDDKLWCVSGSYAEGGGILEWCYNQGDAEYLAEKLRLDPLAFGIHTHKFI